ncbi:MULTISPECIES: NAD(P)/FAD-dependent oxidoreductase [unclassified Dietzia]|uniref:NAD(P)/FAD-dependent oxidoreductase n=1 Tax=unclassified Dietzia TaxID=2617939 RepID=UPI0015F9275B|nr:MULTISPECIES: NAD(P)/FAD-dependent oxidoreductase [unclassified Dietzia]MBB1023316.1 NAD(P)/FAD-dependent oxidoreductase [Dietzia sp. DQ12-76]MBB1028176.1 NAD(P)/FAD-dependent oxidoreductase [Dietzia sp. DQ11-38-2]
MSSPIPDAVEVAVIGAGPAGLTAALVLGRQKRTVVLVDSGQPRNAPATEMHMYLGLDGRSPKDLRRTGMEEVAGHPNVEIVHSTVTGIEVTGPDTPVSLATSDGRSFLAERLLVTAGVRDDVSGIPGVAARFGQGVYHCPFCHGHEVDGRRLAVLTDAPENPAQPGLQAVYLATHFSRDVTLLTNGHPVPDEIRETLARNGVGLEHRPVTELGGTDGALTVSVGDEELTFGAVFHTPREQPRDSVLGLDLETEGAHILVDWQQRTSDPRVFAAGDCARRRDDPVPLAFVARAVAAGQAAGLWIDQDLFRAQAGLG